MENSRTRDNTYFLIILTLPLYIFNPMIAILFYFISNCNKLTAKERLYTKNSLFLFCILLAVFMSAINMVKVPQNDLVWYIESYQKASDYDLFPFVLIGSSADFSESGKEPLFGLIVWLMNRVYGGNVMLYKFSISMISYILLTFPFVKITARYDKIDNKYILAGLMLMCFIPYIFTMSLHLLRQFIAGAILIYVSIDKCFFNKNDYLLLLAMPLFHTSSVLFIPFLFLPFLSENINRHKKLYSLLIITVALYPLIAKLLSSLGVFSNIGAVEYALSRASNDNKESSLGPFTPIMIFLLLSVISISYFIGYKWRYRKERGIKRLAHLQLFLSLFIIGNLADLELANRFYFYLFPFIAIDFIFLFDRLKLNRGILNIIVILMMIFFSSYLYWGAWEYKLVINPWLQPIFMYFV